MKTSFFEKNVGEWLQVPRPYFCISPHKIAHMSTLEAPCLHCTIALVYLLGMGQRCKKAMLVAEAACLLNTQPVWGNSAAPADPNSL